MPLRHERAEALAGRALEMQLDRVVGQARRRRSAASSRCRVIVPTTRLTLRIGSVGRDLLAALEGRLAESQQRGVVQRLVQAVVLRDLAVAADRPAPRRAGRRSARSRGRCALQWSTALRGSSWSVRPIISLNVRKPSWAIISRTSCGDEAHEIDDVLRRRR